MRSSYDGVKRGRNVVAGKVERIFPPGLKPPNLFAKVYGTTKVVPLQNDFKVAYYGDEERITFSGRCLP